MTYELTEAVVGRIEDYRSELEKFERHPSTVRGFRLNQASSAVWFDILDMAVRYRFKPSSMVALSFRRVSTQAYKALDECAKVTMHQDKLRRLRSYAESVARRRDFLDTLSKDGLVTLKQRMYEFIEN